jgi:DNA (cytosine-5)-methyltransferase 1
MAGKRLGKEDERHLWPEMLRAIREIQPRWVVGENVFGLINWSAGLVFHEVQADLEAEGYEVQPYVLPAVSVNAPHRRDRVWFVAYSNGNGRGYLRGQKQKCTFETHSKYCNTCDVGITTYTKYKGFQRQCREWKGCTEYRNNEGILIGSEDKFNDTNINNEGLEREASKRIQTEQGRTNRFYDAKLTGMVGELYWRNFPTVSPICSRDDGLSDRLDGITFPKWRNESIKAAGNAIVPQVVHQIFKAIEQYEKA